MSVANTTRAVNIAPPQQAAGQVVNLLPDGSLVVECEGRGWHCRRAGGGGGGRGPRTRARAT
ncbi:hypothetical protein GXN80_03365, partial [Serratia marcescens]|nr:hypothetical protein [Serratia marcescens]